MRGPVFGHGEDVVGPHPRPVHHRARRNGELVVGLLITTGDTLDAAVGVFRYVDDTNVVCDVSVEVSRCGLGERESDARVVATGVVVEKARDESLGAQRGQMCECVVARDATITMPNTPASAEVVDPQRRGVTLHDGLGRYAVGAKEGNQKRQGLDEVGRVEQKSLTFAHILVYQSELPLLE